MSDSDARQVDRLLVHFFLGHVALKETVVRLGVVDTFALHLGWLRSRRNADRAALQSHHDFVETVEVARTDPGYNLRPSEICFSF